MHGEDRKFESAGYSKLVEDVYQVPFHSFFADGESVGNHFIAAARGHSRDDIFFAISQVMARMSDVRDQASQGGAIDPNLPFQHAANTLEQQLGGSSFVKNPACPARYGLAYFKVTERRHEQDGPYVKVGIGKALQYLNATEFRHDIVEEEYVRP